MIKPTSKKIIKVGRKKKPLTPEQIQRREQKIHEKNFKMLFEKLGFFFVHADGIEINYKGRTGEIDGLFVFQNVLLIVEYTIGKPNTGHLFKKKILYEKILDDVSAFLEFAVTKYPALGSALDPLYPRELFKAKVIYASKHEPSAELIEACPQIKFLHGSNAKYFQALVKTIERSARIEFLKFLGFDYEDVGDAAVSSGHSSLAYEGFLLPDGNSSYPKNYKIVSFYADPERLISKSYVLRRDGWRDSSHLYQRILITEKIRQMRRYLIQEKRVFVNNIIVTLPPETQLNFEDGTNLAQTEMNRVRPVTVSIPPGFDTIGLVDGQHRVFCYHEGSDAGEEQIKILRKRQNLMVTGIVYPKGVSEVDRRRFEAKLFLEINDNQARAKSALKQDIEVIIRPNSGIAIAKRIVQELNRKGPYKGLLQTNFFDASTKIKTSSIVSYGLRPLVKLDGTDSLFFAWKHPEKQKLKDAKGSDESQLLEEYIAYCTKMLNDFFIDVKLSLPGYNWDVEAKPCSPLLSIMGINGMIACLRKIIESGQELSSAQHKVKLKNLEKVNFQDYKSSQWQRLGVVLFSNHYI